MFGFGLAAIVLFWFAFDDPQTGLGIGGALGVLGVTYYLSSFLVTSESVPPPASRNDADAGH